MITLIDEYQLAEFEAKLHFAIAENKPVVLTTYDNGPSTDIFGYIHYIDEITKELRLVLAETGEVARVEFASLVGVEVVG
ncbi:YolD-like family protein [Bacillus massiliglaciei]|uniref:YolD-like family protein n=1 Tax=Bacillus massiliglaciei TaxID=1816693 RepID=UPI000DA62539|nr:YolD-like family protein [Bacillus massiliglaciei]